MNIKETLISLKESQFEVMKKFTENQESACKLDPIIQKICQKELDNVFGVKTLVSITGGFASLTWDPTVFVYPFQKYGKTFVKINGKWTWYDEAYIYMDVYSHKILDSQDFPFDPAELERTCDLLEEELGLKFSIISYKTKKVDRPNNIDDLKEIYPNLKIISSGRIDSMGWDIPDYYAFVFIDEKTHLFYSSNGHGMGYDHHIEPTGDFSPFFEFISEKSISLDDGTWFNGGTEQFFMDLLKNNNP